MPLQPSSAQNLTLALRPLTTGDEPQARAAARELAADGFDFLLAPEGTSFAEVLERLDRERAGRDLPPGRVPATFLVAVVGDDLVGRVSVRHELNEHLARIGGHVGYAVRPAFRRRGYATAMLRQSLALADSLGIDPALITCDDTNVPSIRVIERCGGVLQDVVMPAAGEVGKRRYWVPTGRPYIPGAMSTNRA